jgi:hypothetical protein
MTKYNISSDDKAQSSQGCATEQGSLECARTQSSRKYDEAYYYLVQDKSLGT